jgi:hypothetical protein
MLASVLICVTHYSVTRSTWLGVQGSLCCHIVGGSGQGSNAKYVENKSGKLLPLGQGHTGAGTGVCTC